MSELYDVLKLVADHSQLAKDDPEFFLPEEIADRVCHVLLAPPPSDGGLRELSKVQADAIEAEMRRLEADPTVTKHALRLFMQHLMPCGHAAGNLLTCDRPPNGCVICGSPTTDGALREALLKARTLIVAMDDWNKAVEKTIGKVPNTGFERAGDILADIDAALGRPIQAQEESIRLCPVKHGAEHEMDLVWYCETCGHREDASAPVATGPDALARLSKMADDAQVAEEDGYGLEWDGKKLAGELRGIIADLTAAEKRMSPGDGELRETAWRARVAWDLNSLRKDAALGRPRNG